MVTKTPITRALLARRDFFYGALRHNCGSRIVDNVGRYAHHGINTYGIRWHCPRCVVYYSFETLARFTDEDLAERFYLEREEPEPGVKRLVWCDYAGELYLTLDPPEGAKTYPYEF